MAGLDSLLAEEQLLQFTTFTNDDAWEPGTRLVEAARADSAGHDRHPLRRPAVLPRRASGHVGRSSLAVNTALRLEGRTIEDTYLLDEAEYAPHGGAFPVTVKGGGVAGTVAVSGLPQEDDHSLVVSVLHEFLAEREPSLDVRSSHTRPPRTGPHGAESARSYQPSERCLTPLGELRVSADGAAAARSTRAGRP